MSAGLCEKDYENEDTFSLYKRIEKAEDTASQMEKLSAIDSLSEEELKKAGKWCDENEGHVLAKAYWEANGALYHIDQLEGTGFLDGYDECLWFIQASVRDGIGLGILAIIAAEEHNAPHEGPGGFSPGPLDAVVGPQTNG